MEKQRIYEISNMKAKDKEKLRKPILKEFFKLQKKFGHEEVRYTFNWWNVREMAKTRRQKKISELKKEIGEIEGGKLPY